jgi:hypothetical protein
MSPGTEVVLTRAAHAKFDQVSPAAKVASRNVVSSDLGGGISAFQTDFSIMSALEEISYLHGLAATGQLKEHHMSDKVLKTAAALQVVTGYRGAYVPGGRQVAENSQTH